MNKLEQYKNNCEENYDITPISVLRYITELQKRVEELEGLVEEVLRYQSWSDINKNHITVFQSKLKQIQEGE